MKKHWIVLIKSNRFTRKRFEENVRKNFSEFNLQKKLLNAKWTLFQEKSFPAKNFYGMMMVTEPLRARIRCRRVGYQPKIGFLRAFRQNTLKADFRKSARWKNLYIRERTSGRQKMAWKIEAGNELRDNWAKTQQMPVKNDTAKKTRVDRDKLPFACLIKFEKTRK